ncbi:hypothetical protein GHT07_16820 [Caenimonas koreensis DSM 17982]|uniref:YdhG-like domain-containing protein n=1 Tax=Caenimonas koreensis DSM 17982 TaxID=1121255 RepID=A0A844BEQ7_9BURK|nr:DUF1801 domain-containing protein [Caenimonas koreensis]MRD48941.1 hypothetical protein [Caenimonas koreensis DSM 17982]
MPVTDPRIDAYIAKSAEFARPVLDHLRAVVHTACPDVEETIKWSMPFFLHGAKSAWPRPSSGWKRASRGTGNTRTASGTWAC